ncbi:MAG: hypothetical protein GY861_16600 [bacterium]|nr:hypothetical protein [bacterium]
MDTCYNCIKFETKRCEYQDRPVYVHICDGYQFDTDEYEEPEYEDVYDYISNNDVIAPNENEEEEKSYNGESVIYQKRVCGNCKHECKSRGGAWGCRKFEWDD